MTDLFPEAIETERLRLERTSPETVDVHELYEICSADPGIEDVTEFVPWQPHATPKETFDFLERKAQQFEDGEKAPYVIRPREGEDGAGEIAGQCGLRPEWERRRCELNVWLRQRFWGRGYSGERAAALLALAFDRLDLEVAAVRTVAGNERSRRAIEGYVERFGGQRDARLVNDVVVDGEPRDQVRYSVHREEWADNRPEDLEVRFRD